MITLIILLLILIVGLGLALGLISIVGSILVGAGAIVLDVLIGIAPFVLIYYIYKIIKRRANGEE